MFCILCHQPLQYVHGHGTCLNRHCPMRGQNQAPCCDGATMENDCPDPDKDSPDEKD